MSKTLVTDLLMVVARVRNDILPGYDAHPSHQFTATVARLDIDRAERAMEREDEVEMSNTYGRLAAYKDIRKNRGGLKKNFQVYATRTSDY